MESSPRQIFIDLIRDLQNLSILFDTKIDSKCLSNLEVDILKSFCNNLFLTIKLGYSVDSLSSTKLHSHLFLLLEMSVELLSRNIENKSEEVYLEEFFSYVLNIFRILFKFGFYGNGNLSNYKDNSKLRNLLLNSIGIELSVKYYHHLYKKYLLPVLFNFIFYTDEWIRNINHLLSDNRFFVILPTNKSADVNDQKVIETNEIIITIAEQSVVESVNNNNNNDDDNDDGNNADIEKESVGNIENKTDDFQSVLFMPFQLKSIAVRSVRRNLITRFAEFQSIIDLDLPEQISDDIRFVEPTRTRFYCRYLSNILEFCPHKLKDVINQQFFIS